MITPVILCGGSGTRLWPRSRIDKPKPFLPLVGEGTLFGQTLGRLAEPGLFTPPLVVTGAAHLAHVTAELAGYPAARVIVEPAPRGTAAAIALASLLLPEDAVMLVCPSDHHIADTSAFVAAATAAARQARAGWLVALGITPTAPDTGFGYIRHGEALGTEAYQIARFIEKPPLAAAEAMLAEGGHSWNGGIFAFRAGDLLAELEVHRPTLLAAVRASVAAGGWQAEHFYPDAAAFAAITAESIDYAVMEPTNRAAMVPVAMGWSDIGTWPALHAARARDGEGNAVRGLAELIDCRNVLVDSDGPRVSVIGLADVVVVVDGDEVLVTSAHGAQKVGTLAGARNQKAKP